MTAIPASINPISRRGERRWRFGLISAGIVAGVLLCVVLLNLLGSRFSRRIDVTSTGEQKLADRTTAVLTSLKQPHRLVIAAPMANIDRRARERILDVLAEMQRAGSNFTVTIINTGAPSGITEYHDVVAELAQRDSAKLKDQSAAIELTCLGASALSGYLSDTLSPALLAIGEQVSPGTTQSKQNKQFFEDTAAAARLSARELAAVVTRVNEHLKAKVDDIPLPATDKAAATLVDSLSPLLEQLGALAKELRKITDAGADSTLVKDLGPAADAVKPIVPEIEHRRDQLATVLDPLKRLRRPDILRITDVLKRGSAAILIGPLGATDSVGNATGGITAIDIESLFPSNEYIEAAKLSNADMGRRAEDLVATTLSALSGPPKPIVIILHAEQRSLLDKTPYANELQRRLGLRGIDLIEWPCVLEAEPSALTRIDPTGKRPHIYATIAPDSSASGAKQGDDTGAQRAEKLGRALNALADKGENVLLSMNPSVMPGYGSPDPTVTILSKFGLSAQTGKPLLHEKFNAQNGRVAMPELTVQAADTEHPISRAVKNLPTFLPWPIAVSRAKTDDGDNGRLTVSPLYTTPTDGATWAESQWLRLWQTRAEERALIPDQPAFEAGRDLRAPEDADAKQPVWTLAMAAERPRPSSDPGTQRFVAVGSNGWFFDGATQRGAKIDGRMAPLNPGNSELFDACISWLAHQDDLIAQSPTARTLPVVMPMEEKRLLVLRLAVVIGLPLLVLVVGGLYRLVRG